MGTNSATLRFAGASCHPADLPEGCHTVPRGSRARICRHTPRSAPLTRRGRAGARSAGWHEGPRFRECGQSELEGGANEAAGLARSGQIGNDHATSGGLQGPWVRDHGVGTQSR